MNSAAVISRERELGRPSSCRSARSGSDRATGSMGYIRPLGPAGNMAIQRRLSTPAIQRTCGCGGSAAAGGECAECNAKREAAATPLLRKSSGSIGTGEKGAPPLVHDVLRSPGRPLDASTRASMEPHFGQEFGDVRVHTDARAADSARSVHALAYTVGSHVVFGSGQFSPATPAGRTLLAHELTHTIQQRSASSVTPGKLEVSQGGDESEQEAEIAASAVAAGRPVQPGHSFGARLSRQQDGSGNDGSDSANQSVAPPIVYLCSKNLSRSPIGKHAFFRFGGSGTGNRTYSLEPVDRGGDCWQGEPQYDFSEDVNADADCEATSLSASCLSSAFIRYPIGHYCTLGPNSNTFVGTLARACGMSDPDPPGWTPGIDDSPPPSGTYAPSPGSTVTGCTTKICDASIDRPPGGIPV